MNRDVLCRPFPPELIKQRQGQGGKMLSYLETHVVIARLNEGCDAWSFEVVQHQMVEDEVIVVGKLIADGIVKMAFGGATVTRDRDGRIVDLGDTHKAAASDAIKKAASLLGVGLELYAGDRPTTSKTHGPATSRASSPRPPTPPSDRLTSRQLAAIHAVARRRGIGGPSMTAMLLERWGCEGPQHLTRKAASEFISELSGSNGSG